MNSPYCAFDDKEEELLSLRKHLFQTYSSRAQEYVTELKNGRFDVQTAEANPIVKNSDEYTLWMYGCEGRILAPTISLPAYDATAIFHDLRTTEPGQELWFDHNHRTPPVRGINGIADGSVMRILGDELGDDIAWTYQGGPYLRLPVGKLEDIAQHVIDQVLPRPENLKPQALAHLQEHYFK